MQITHATSETGSQREKRASQSGGHLLSGGDLMTARVFIFLCLWASGFAAEAKPEMSTYVYKHVGALEIKADVYRPSGFTTPRPVLVWIHGGALMLMGREYGPNEQLRNAMLAAGVVVVSLDYRLAPETHLPEMLGDIEDGFRWVREKGPTLFAADPARILVAGPSAGGYLALVAGYRVKPRPLAIVDFFGWSDLLGPSLLKPSRELRHTKVTVSREEARKAVLGPAVTNQRDRPPGLGARDFFLYCRQDGTFPLALTGWDPKSEAEKFYPYIPLRNVTSDYPPTLLIHGLKDTEIPVEQSIRMLHELQTHGVEARLITDPDADHASNWSPDAMARIQKAAAEFLQAHLR
jgi:acetyl esterase/lipase